MAKIKLTDVTCGRKLNYYDDDNKRQSFYLLFEKLISCWNMNLVEQYLKVSVEGASGQ